ncbi:MAG: zinc-ribbon domain-containing protein [Lachnospiraceae bacterium]|nr:zinc-ribbon domain-containing protein [Lachnospiraceae bacterium]
MAKKYVGFSGVFCPHCGERVEKGETICPSCKKTYSLDDCFKGVSALGAAGKGWTENADDISLKRFAKKNLKGSVIGMFVVSVIIAAVIWFTSGMNMDRFEKEWYVVVGPLIIIWVFWLIWLIMQFGKSKSWEGTVTEKERKEYKSASRDEDGHKHVETTVFYILHFKDTKGKNRKLTQRSTTGWYEYLKEGDRIRYHGKHTSYYEKYDKSADEEIPCAGCGKSCDARAAYCDRCGCILFKAPSAENKTDPLNETPDLDNGESSKENEIENVKKFCGKCGAAVKPGAAFCGKCGSKL